MFCLLRRICLHWLTCPIHWNSCWCSFAVESAVYLLICPIDLAADYLNLVPPASGNWSSLPCLHHWTVSVTVGLVADVYWMSVVFRLCLLASLSWSCFPRFSCWITPELSAFVSALFACIIELVRPLTTCMSAGLQVAIKIDLAVLHCCSLSVCAFLLPCRLFLLPCCYTELS